MSGPWPYSHARPFSSYHASKTVCLLAEQLQKQRPVGRVLCKLLALLNQFRTFDWAEEYKYPTVILSQMKELLAEPQQG